MQIKEREQVSRNDKRFNVGKTKKIFKMSNTFVRVLYSFRRMAILDPNYPHLTKYNVKRQEITFTLRLPCGGDNCLHVKRNMQDIPPGPDDIDVSAHAIMTSLLWVFAMVISET